MKQQRSLLPEHISSEDWENTPASVKCLVNSLIANVALSGNDRKCNEVEDSQAKAALKESELKLSNLINAIPGAVYQFRLNAEGELSIVFMSQGIRDLGEISPEQVVGDIQVIWDLIVHGDLESLHRSIAVSAQTLERWSLEFRIQTASGKIKWILGESLPHQQEGGEVIWDGILIDITDRKQAEAAFRESESRFQALADNVPGVIFGYCLRPDGSDQYTYISSGFVDLYGFAPDEALQDTSVVFNMTHPDDLELLQKSITESSRTMETWQCQYRIITLSGQIKWVQGISRPTQQPNGDLIWDGLIIDISDRKFVEERFREQHTQLDLVVEASQIGFYISDFRTETSIVSPAYKTQLGYAPDAIEASPGDWNERLHQMIEKGQSLLFENLRTTKPRIAEIFAYDIGMVAIDGFIVTLG